jgi:hypothetical protein
MKFYKRQSLNHHEPSDNAFAIEADGRLVSDNTTSFKLPGGTIAQRPANTTLGQIRHNTQYFDIETYVRGVWERVRTVRPASILVQNLGSGNYYSSIFGPLSTSYTPSYLKSSANIQVYVDNVFQIPETNYSLVTDPSPVTASTTATSALSTTTLYLDTVQNVQPGQTISGSLFISSSTTVVGTITGTTNIIISQPVTGSIGVGVSLTFTFSTGTFIQFSGAVPAKPVVAIMGYDGYFPPG